MASLRISERSDPWLEGVLLALAAGALLVLGGETVRASYHGLLHATAGQAVWREGLRPENPWHAGTALRYYTLYPAAGVGLGRLAGGALAGFALLNILAALLFPPALDRLGHALGLGRRERRWAFLAAVLGFNGFGWLGWFLVEGPGLGAAPVFSLAPLSLHGSSLGWDARLQAFLPKYLNVSGFALALPFALGLLARALEAEATVARGLRGGLGTGFAAGVALAWNPLVGGLSALAAALVLASAWWRSPCRAAFLLGTLPGPLLALPFLLPLLAPPPGGESLVRDLAVAGHPLADLLGPLLWLLPPGLAGLVLLEPGRRRRLLLLLAVLAGVVLAGSLPWANEYKAARLGGVLWALPAGLALARLRASRRPGRPLPVLLLLLALPTTLLTAAAYLAWGAQASPPPVRSTAAGFLPRLPGIWPEAFRRAEDGEEDAVWLLHPGQPGSRIPGGVVQGNALAPLLHHPLYVDEPQIHNDAQPDLARRLDEVEVFFEVSSVTPWSEERPASREEALDAIRRRVAPRPLLVVTRPEMAGAVRSLQLAGARRLAHEEGLSLWRLPPPPAPAAD